MLVLRVDAAQPQAGPANIIISMSERNTLLYKIRIPLDNPTSPELLEDLRWLMEDFLADATSAGTVRAAATKTRLRGEGERLFRAVFEGAAETAQLWHALEGRLHETRVEVSAASAALAATLWELITPPQTGLPLCLSVDSFVRVAGASSLEFGVRQVDICRVLLITSRPAGIEDISYRSTAVKVFAALRTTRECDIVFLRPPTFPACARVLRDAKATGRPFDIVHFDGHGLQFEKDGAGSDPQTLILFEDAEMAGGRPISGREFANLLAETGPTAVVLDACRSARIDVSVDRADGTAQALATSFSQELLASGVPIVIAMNFNVYVASATRFMTEFYRQLSRGQALTTAVALARKDMATDSRRSDGLTSFHIDDWLVPVVLQAGTDLAIKQHTDSVGLQPEASADPRPPGIGALPPAPDLGFIGADDGLLAIDRAFDENHVVLTYGLAGAGKSAAAVEFARWYFATGGVVERPLFSSFEEKKTLDMLLSDIEPTLIRFAGPNWARWTAKERAQFAPGLLSGQSLLWIWDNVETLNALSTSAQMEITGFLRSAAAAGVKFLLTSRGREQPLLGYLPARIDLPPLRLSDSSEFARVLISRLGRQAAERSSLVDLLVFCEGNPLTLTVALTSLFCKYDKPTASQIAAFLGGLRSGQIALEDEDTSDRNRSLTASLQTAFDALNQTTLRLVSLLYLFRRYVNVNVLFGMFRPVQDDVFDPGYDRDWTLREFAEETPASIDRILFRAAEVGLLKRPKAQHYWLHPALHIHLKKYFRRFFPQRSGFERAARAFAESLGGFSILFTIGHSYGRKEDVITALSDEEDNLRLAFAWSREFGWHQATVGLLHGVFTLYYHTGRRIEWAQLLSDALPDFMGTNGEAMAGKERWWTFMMDQAVRLELWRRDFPRAEQLARAVLSREEKTAAPLQNIPADQLSRTQWHQLQSFAIALARVADILRERQDPDCLGFNERALGVYTHINDRVGIPIRLFNLGHVFKNIAAHRDLAIAGEYYVKAYDSYPEQDDVSRFQCLAQLGSVDLERLKDELKGKKRQSVLNGHLDTAVGWYKKALEGTEPDDLLGLANVHNQLGVAYQYLADEQATAFEHFRMAIEYFDQAGESYEAASARNNGAQVLATLQRFEEAIILAQEALSAFESFDPSAPLAIHLRRLVARLQRQVDRQQ